MPRNSKEEKAQEAKEKHSGTKFWAKHHNDGKATQESSIHTSQIL